MHSGLPVYDTNNIFWSPEGKSAGSLYNSGMESTQNAGLAGLILAAGQSSRLGRPKQLLLYQGESLLIRTIRIMAQICQQPVHVVLGAQADIIEPMLTAEPVQVIHNADWRNGMASSIRCGVEQLPDETRGLLIMVCDQPLVTVADIGKLAHAWHADSEQVIAAEYADGSAGVPAIFPASMFSALQTLQGAGGAQQLIAAAPSRVLLPLPGVGLDIDTPADLEALVNHSSVN